jgi:hypothetical protein
MLFIDHGEREVMEGNVFLKKRVSAYQKVDIAEHKTVQDLLAGGSPFAPSQNGHAKAGGIGQDGNCCEMLPREDLGWRHEGRLPSGLNDGSRGRKRYNCLSRSDITLQKAQHALRAGEVGNDVVHGLLLRMGERVRQRL